MTYPEVMYIDFDRSPEGCPARVMLKIDDPYFEAPQRDDANNGQLILPLFVYGFDQAGNPIGAVWTSHWRDLTEQEERRLKLTEIILGPTHQ